jgi:branched-chain amino acid transport system permease protein
MAVWTFNEGARDAHAAARVYYAKVWPAMFLQHFFNALTLGSLYGLIAIGYTMVYGILRLINFAHGDMLMLGAYCVFFGTVTFHLPWGVAIVAAIVAVSLLGILVDRAAYRPLRKAPRISALISAIAVSFFIESLAVVLFTGLPRPVYQPDWLITPFTVGSLRLIPLTLVVPVVAAALVLILIWVVHRTRPGLAMRSISHDIETTRLMGVRVDRIIALTFGIGTALAAASGIMWALRYPQIQPYMGVFPGMKAFIAAVFGGIGSIPGAMVGGLCLGFIEIMAIAFFPTLSGYRDAFAFILLIAVLLVKPAGLFGARLEEKI